MNKTMLAIDPALAQETLNYLATCPYKDVFKLVEGFVKLQPVDASTPANGSSPAPTKETA